MKMNMTIPVRRQVRRGYVIALVALLLPLIFGVLAALCRRGRFRRRPAQLVTEGDAAALAGAAKLNDPARINPNYSLSGDISAAQSQALKIGRANKVLGQNAVLNANTNNDPNGDVVIGYIDMTAPNSSLVTSSVNTSLFNSVQVKAQSTSDHGGSVPAFFSKLLGFGDTPLVVQSTATVQNYAISGFKCSPSGTYTKMIPITLSLTTYDAMLAAAHDG